MNTNVKKLPTMSELVTDLAGLPKEKVSKYDAESIKILQKIMKDGKEFMLDDAEKMDELHKRYFPAQ